MSWLSFALFRLPSWSLEWPVCPLVSSTVDSLSMSRLSYPPLSYDSQPGPHGIPHHYRVYVGMLRLRRHLNISIRYFYILCFLPSLSAMTPPPYIACPQAQNLLIRSRICHRNLSDSKNAAIELRLASISQVRVIQSHRDTLTVLT